MLRDSNDIFFFSYDFLLYYRPVIKFSVYIA